MLAGVGIVGLAIVGWAIVPAAAAVGARGRVHRSCCATLTAAGGRAPGRPPARRRAPWFFVNDSTYQIELAGEPRARRPQPLRRATTRRSGPGALLQPRRQQAGRRTLSSASRCAISPTSPARRCSSRPRGARSPRRGTTCGWLVALATLAPAAARRSLFPGPLRAAARARRAAGRRQPDSSCGPHGSARRTRPTPAPAPARVRARTACAGATAGRPSRSRAADPDEAVRRCVGHARSSRRCSSSSRARGRASEARPPTVCAAVVAVRLPAVPASPTPAALWTGHGVSYGAGHLPDRRLRPLGAIAERRTCSKTGTARYPFFLARDSRSGCR